MKKALCILLLSSLAWAEPQIKVFSLANRPAAATVEVVQALLKPGESVWPKSQPEQLIVKAAPERLEEIRKLLEQIDVAAPQVWLTIAQSASNPGSGGYVGVGGAQVYDGNQEVSSQQQLLVMSGEQGSITVGEDVPVVQPFWQFANGLGMIPPGVVFQRVSTGFSVQPTVVGQKIRLRLTPWMSYFGAQGNGRIEFSQSATSLTLNNGETVSIAASSGNQSSQNRALGLVLGEGWRQSSSSNTLVVTAEIKEEPPPLPPDK